MKEPISKGDLNNSIFTEPINEPEKSNMNDTVSETYPTVSSLSTQPVKNKKTHDQQISEYNKIILNVLNLLSIYCLKL